jgi:hypothetical protein
LAPGSAHRCWSYLDRGRYEKQILRLGSVTDRVHLVLFEDLVRDPRRALSWIRRRLGLLPVADNSLARFEARRLPDAPDSQASAPRPLSPTSSTPAPEIAPRRELSSEELLAELEADPRLGGERVVGLVRFGHRVAPPEREA